MAIVRNIFKLSHIVGNYRNFLSSRIILPTYQPIATLKRSTEMEFGLPVKPKKPKTPYFRFLEQMRPLIKEKHPGMRMADMVKMIALEWQKADKSIKQKLEKEYEGNREQYREAYKNYLNSITDEQKKLIQDAKIKEKIANKQKLHKKEMKVQGKPKQPTSAFAFYTRSTRTKKGDLSIADWIKAMKVKWEALPQKEKEVYEIEAAKSREEYKTNMRLWQAKMAAMDNANITESVKSKQSTE